MNQFLIPANSKKSMLKLGLFNWFDITVLSIGIIITMILLFVIKDANMGQLILMLSPALIAVLMVMPVPPYHNVMTLLGNIVRFYTGIKKYYWRGWCASYERERSKR